MLNSELSSFTQAFSNLHDFIALITQHNFLTILNCSFLRFSEVKNAQTIQNAHTSSLEMSNTMRLTNEHILKRLSIRQA